MAITCAENKYTAEFDRRFGRAACFCLFDEISGITQFVENNSSGETEGIGTRAAERMAGLGINKIISGDFGPKAMELLNKFDIQMVILQTDSITVQEILDKLKNKTIN